MTTGKIWGKTEAVLQNPLVEFHRIDVKEGYRCSAHRHKHKWNLFYVVSGELAIHVMRESHPDDITILKAGDHTAVAPGVYHEFRCWKDCVAFELYYPEALSEDIERLDVGGRW